MRQAVENLGDDSMTAKGSEMSQLAKLGIVRELAKLRKHQELFKGKFGGGEWSRTTDAADMSRVHDPLKSLIRIAYFLWGKPLGEKTAENERVTSQVT